MLDEDVFFSFYVFDVWILVMLRYRDDGGVGKVGLGIGLLNLGMMILIFKIKGGMLDDLFDFIVSLKCLYFGLFGLFIVVFFIVF